MSSQSITHPPTMERHQQVLAQHQPQQNYQEQNQQQGHQQNQQQQQLQAQSSQPQQQFSCLFTKQLTQKRKKWHDGRLVVKYGRATLYDANPAVGAGDPSLDECEITSPQNQAILQSMETRVETGKHIIEIQGPWATSSVSTAISKVQPLVSNGMKKVLTKKFRKSGKYVPPPPAQQQQPSWSKRSRPLQPGELQRRYYGNQQQTQAPPSGWNQEQQQQQQAPPSRRNQEHQQDQPPPPSRWKQQLQQQQLPSANRWNQPSNQHSQQRPPSHNTPSPQQQESSHDHRQQSYADPSPQQHQPQVQQKPHSRDQSIQQQQPQQLQRPPNHHGSGKAPSWKNPRADDQPNNPAGLSRQEPGPPFLSGPVATPEGKENAALPRDPFAANGFTPSSFYGEEGDDEEDLPTQFNWDEPISQHTESAAAPQQQVVAPSVSPPQEVPPEPKRQRVAELNTSSVAALPPIADSVTNATTSDDADTSGDGGALSTLELLQLFGASSASGNATTTTETVTAAPPAQESYVEDATDKGVAGEEKTPEKAADFQFVLPPASDSSSDEEE